MNVTTKIFKDKKKYNRKNKSWKKEIINENGFDTDILVLSVFEMSGYS